MIDFPNELKPQTFKALLELRSNFDGTDTQFAKKWGINPSVYSRLKNGEDGSYGLLRDATWINIAQQLEIGLSERKWNMARTDVFTMIEEDVIFCKAHAKSFILVDDCGIGKTYAGKYLSRTLKNCFYIDARQCGSKTELVRALAKAIGVDDTDRIAKIKASIKYALKMLPNPVVIIDEAGALNDEASMLIIEFWNATEKACGWFLMGADGLRNKMESRIDRKKVGWAELFSRFNERYNSIVPTEKQNKISFYKKLITDVLTVNMENKSKLNEIVRMCLNNDSGRISGLRRAETLLILNS